MALLLDNKKDMPQADIEKLFNAGISYMHTGEYAFAFWCFCRTGKSDLHTLYNKALCCHCIDWFTECHALLREAEMKLPSVTECRLSGLPEPFVRWQRDRCVPLCPVPYDAPKQTAAIQILILKAENAYKMHLYGEVRNIAAFLGGKYRRIDELLKMINYDDM